MEHDLRFNICELEDISILNKDVFNPHARISKHIAEALLRYVPVDSSRLTHLGQSNVNTKESAEKVSALLNSGRDYIGWKQYL